MDKPSAVSDFRVALDIAVILLSSALSREFRQVTRGELTAAALTETWRFRERRWAVFWVIGQRRVWISDSQGFPNWM